MSIKKLLNPTANANNILEFHTSEAGCSCPTTLSTSKYEVTGIAFTGTAYSDLIVKIDGVNKTLDLGANVTTKKQLRVAITTALRTVGYDAHYSMDNIIGIATGDTTLSLIGEAELVSIKYGTTTKNFTKKSTLVRVSVSTFSTPHDLALTIKYGENDEVVAAQSAGDEVDFDAGVTAALTTLIGASKLLGVTVTSKNTNFVVTITAIWDVSIVTMNDAYIKADSVYPDYIA